MSSALVNVLRQALYLLLVVAAPPVLAVLAVGVASAVLQTATALRERSLSSVPKWVAALLALALAGPFIGARLIAFMHAMLVAVPTLGRS